MRATGMRRTAGVAPGSVRLKEGALERHAAELEALLATCNLPPAVPSGAAHQPINVEATLDCEGELSNADVALTLLRRIQATATDPASYQSGRQRLTASIKEVASWGGVPFLPDFVDKRGSLRVLRGRARIMAGLEVEMEPRVITKAEPEAVGESAPSASAASHSGNHAAADLHATHHSTPSHHEGATSTDANAQRRLSTPTPSSAANRVPVTTSAAAPAPVLAPASYFFLGTAKGAPPDAPSPAVVPKPGRVSDAKRGVEHSTDALLSGLGPACKKLAASSQQEPLSKLDAAEVCGKDVMGGFRLAMHCSHNTTA